MEQEEEEDYEYESSDEEEDKNESSDEFKLYFDEDEKLINITTNLPIKDEPEDEEISNETYLDDLFWDKEWNENNFQNSTTIDQFENLQLRQHQQEAYD